MHDLLTAAILGIVEGLTEFLPVSSSGHLIIAEDLLHFTGETAATFSIFIQLGAILAVVLIYWQRFIGLLRPRASAQFSGLRGIFLLILTSLPVTIVGLLAYRFIKEELFSTRTVCLALLVGAVCILVVERLPKKTAVYSLDSLSPARALGIGCFQCLALWPGFSRSASTIMGGMLFGLDRKTAAEYSFIAAVPVIAGAALLDLLKNIHLLTGANIWMFAVGFVVSFLSAWVAIKTFINLLGRVTLAPFAVYRLGLAALVYFYLVR